MAGIYIHIPFCRQACHYCNFHFSTSLRQKDALIEALLQEIATRTEYLDERNIESLYIGGGTPSVLDISDIAAIIAKLSDYYTLNDNIEFTLEANPEDLTIEYVKQISSIGINRLSIGVQSFHDNDLKWMNRNHTADAAIDSIKRCQENGLDNISIDLIFGSNTTTMAQWSRNLEILDQLDIPHVSCYGLTVEPRTALHHRIHNEREKPLDDRLGSEQFIATRSKLISVGYDHYEISNYAKGGQYAIHNTNYWKGVPYLGLGPSAHSFDGQSRRWNIANNSSYIKALADGSNYYSTEVLSKQDKFNEYVMTGLRTKWGCDTAKMTSFDDRWSDLLAEEIESLITKGLIAASETTLKLTEDGLLLADHVMSQLFLTD